LRVATQGFASLSVISTSPSQAAAVANAFLQSPLQA